MFGSCFWLHDVSYIISQLSYIAECKVECELEHLYELEPEVVSFVMSNHQLPKENNDFGSLLPV